jgi:hypothetical protein
VVYSSSLTLSAEPYFRLITFRVREIDSGFISITQVPSNVKSFLSSDVLIVIKDIGSENEDDDEDEAKTEKNELWFWVGSDSNDEARRAAALSVSVMLEYMGLPDTLAHHAQVVSEDEVLSEVVHLSKKENNSMREVGGAASLDEQVENKEGSEEEEEENRKETESHKRFTRLLKAMTQTGNEEMVRETEQWWEGRKAEHLNEVVLGVEKWEHVSGDKFWSESCPTARLYQVTVSPKRRLELPTEELLQSFQGTTAVKLKLYFEDQQAKQVTVKKSGKSSSSSPKTSLLEYNYRLKRVPFFLHDDLLSSHLGGLVDAPEGIFAFEPGGLSFEASLFLHQVVAARASERSMIATSALDHNKPTVLPSSVLNGSSSPTCPVFWLNRKNELDMRGREKFQSYFQEFNNVPHLLNQPLASVAVSSENKSAFLYGEVLEDQDVTEW